MTEEENQEAAPEVSEVATEEQVQETERPVVEKKNQDHNWREAREVMRSQQLKIAEMEAKMAAMHQQKEEVEDKYDPEEYAKLSHVDKMADKKISRKTAELQGKIEQLEKKLAQSEQQKMESDVKARHDDYDYVIENFAIPMIEKDKALADALRASPNPYAMAYRLAKASDEYEEVMQKSKAPSSKAEKVIKNVERPTSAKAAGGSLKSQAEYFKDMSPADVWKKAQEYARKG